MAKCGICHQLYEKEGDKCPKLLLCGHTFCLSCLRKEAKGEYIKCHICRKLLQIPRGPVKNIPTNQNTPLATEVPEIDVVHNTLAVNERDHGNLKFLYLHSRIINRKTPRISEQNVDEHNSTKQIDINVEKNSTQQIDIDVEHVDEQNNDYEDDVIQSTGAIVNEDECSISCFFCFCLDCLFGDS